MAQFRVLITSDIHCTDLETWYGVSNEERMERWLEAVHAEHKRHPFDLILINGDVSLDYHQNKTPFDRGYSTAYLFAGMYVSRLPAGVPVLMMAGNHEQFPAETWEKIAGNPRQSHAVLGNNTFVMLDGFRDALLPVYTSDDLYTSMDTDYINSLLKQYPQNNMWLLAHWFEMDMETQAFRDLVAKEGRIKGLFAGHSHDHRLIELGEDYSGKVIAQTGNFSYTMSGAHLGGFWGFRDLVITDTEAVSSYIMVDSDVILEGEKVHYAGCVSEIAHYSL